MAIARAADLVVNGGRCSIAIVAAFAAAACRVETVSSQQPQIVSRHGNVVVICDLDRGSRRVKSWNTPSYPVELVAIAVSPDGRLVAFANVRRDGGTRKFWCSILDARTLEQSDSAGVPGEITSLYWARDGSHLVFEFRDDGKLAFQSFPVAYAPHATNPSRGNFRLGTPGPRTPTRREVESPTVAAVSSNARWAYVLGGGQVEGLDLDSGSGWSIGLPGPSIRGRSFLREDAGSGELYASTSDAGVFRIDVVRGQWERVALPLLDGGFDVAGGRLLAACRDGAMARLFARELVDPSMERGGWVDDGGLLQERTIAALAIAPDGARFAAITQPESGRGGRSSVLLGELATPANGGKPTPTRAVELDADDDFASNELFSSDQFALRFSPDSKWLAFARGGCVTLVSGPMPAPSALRIIEVASGRVVLNVDYEPGAAFHDCEELLAGWCVATDGRAPR